MLNVNINIVDINRNGHRHRRMPFRRWPELKHRWRTQTQKQLNKNHIGVSFSDHSNQHSVKRDHRINSAGCNRKTKVAGACVHLLQFDHSVEDLPPPLVNQFFSISWGFWHSLPAGVSALSKGKS